MSIKSLRRHHLEARTARLGFLGECAVAEALALLASKGWRVFHDVPMEVEGRKFNIDHVAVGTGGVWAIETKAYSKANDVKGGGNGLRIEGETVVLPDDRKKFPLKQARGSARELQVACNAVGVPLRFVEPLVVLPGWNVIYPRGAADRIRDPRNVVAFLEKQEPQSAGDEIEKVAAWLEKKNRVLWFDNESSGR